MSKPFDPWFPTSRHGSPEINVMSFGAFADGTGHPLGSGGSAALNYATLAQAQTEEILHDGRMVGPYPEATELGDYADWCAITAAVKAAFTTDGVSHGNEGYKNRPLTFPAGRYITNKPVLLRGISDALIRGTGYWTQIYNENPVAPDNTCIQAEGVRYSRIENFTFGAVGTNSIAFNLTNAAAPDSFNSHGNVWVTVNFTANGDGGIGCSMGTDGYMGSEQTFIRCVADNNDYGWIVQNPNALTYLFITCLGNLNRTSAIRVNTGGGVVCINCAFSMNGDKTGDSYDIENYASMPVTLINCRSESRKFVKSGGYVFMLSCSHSQTDSETTLVDAGQGARIITTDCAHSRLVGEGEFSLDNHIFNHARYWFQGVSAGTGGVVKITHTNLSTYDQLNPITGLPYHWEHWRDGDEVIIEKVEGTTYPTAPSVNGIWTIHKLDKNNFELVGSTYVADTYKNLTTGEPAGTKGYMGPGPRYHLTGLMFARPPALVGGTPARVLVKDTPLLWMDAGTTYSNLGATGAVTISLPDAANARSGKTGTRYRFVVLEAQTLTVQVNPASSGVLLKPRIFRAGGYATAGLQAASNVVGNMIELELMDSQDGLGHRWLIVSETGTWTISGTPSP